MTDAGVALAKHIGITPRWRSALLSLDKDTPCRSRPELWSNPRSVRAMEAAQRGCSACPISVQCEEFGRASRQTGVFGGLYLISGQVPTHLPFTDRNNAAERAALRGLQSVDVEPRPLPPHLAAIFAGAGSSAGTVARLSA